RRRTRTLPRRARGRRKRMSVFYQILFRSALRHLDAEKVHGLSFAALRGVAAVPGMASLMGRALGPREPELTVRALGKEFPGPLGLAAGFDKNAESPKGLAALGFGFVEIGTVTAHPQPGNPKPRLFRLGADRASLTRMRLNNAGPGPVAGRRPPRPRSGTRPRRRATTGNPKVAPEAPAPADSATSAFPLARYADYLRITPSS